MARVALGGALLAAAVAAVAAFPTVTTAQTPAPHAHGDSTRGVRHGSWKRFAAGFATSILAHEGGHIAAALLQGAHPTFGLDHGRPTIFSGIDPTIHPHQQFMFSSAGLDVQDMLDEGILDTPHHRGGEFERGILAGGIATTAFYLTIGRTARVSDIAFMVRTSGLTSTQVALIYGGVAFLHLVRIEVDGHYADFFVRPSATSDLHVGVDWR
jgi:hypothetical protein